VTKNAVQPKAKIEFGFFMKPSNLFLFWQVPWLINPILFYLFSHHEVLEKNIQMAKIKVPDTRRSDFSDKKLYM